MAESPKSEAIKQHFLAYERDSPEFNRVINLSDAVFAIAMTLLVLTLDVPDVPATQLASALVDQLSQFIALIISFILVAIIWWGHHRFFASLKKLETVIMAINLAFLGAVIILPYPTNLVGNDPLVPVSVMFFIGIFLVMNILHLFMVVRAHNTGVMQQPFSDSQFRWEISSFIIAIMVLLLTLILAYWFPLVSLIIYVSASIIFPILERLTRS